MSTATTIIATLAATWIPFAVSSFIELDTGTSGLIMRHRSTPLLNESQHLPFAIALLFYFIYIHISNTQNTISHSLFLVARRKLTQVVMSKRPHSLPKPTPQAPQGCLRADGFTCHNFQHTFIT